MSAKCIKRGLLALTLSLFFTTNLFAEYLYKDEVVINPLFSDQVNKLGTEVFEKTGIHVYMIMLRELEDNQTIADAEVAIAKKLEEPFVLLTFVEMEKKVDILARPTSLYEDFPKKQILSPSASYFGGFVNAIIFSRSITDAWELISNAGGTILPILGQRAKGEDIKSKYSVAMYNGYSELVEQIAKTHNVKLENAAGNTNKNVLLVLELIFFATIIFGIIKYFVGRRRRHKREKNSL